VYILKFSQLTIRFSNVYTCNLLCNRIKQLLFFSFESHTSKVTYFIWCQISTNKVVQNLQNKSNFGTDSECDRA